MSTPIRVLMIEDREADAELIRHELNKAGFNPAWERVETEADYLAALETVPDLILADWSLPQFNGWRAMNILRERGVDIPFIIVSGSIGEDVAVQAMREGATDYLLKDRLGRLGEAVHRAMREKLLREENKRSENALRDSEAKYRSLVEQSTDGIVVVDEQGRITNWNHRQEEITGIEQKEVLGRLLWEIQYQMMPEETKNPAVRERVKNGLMSLLGSGESPRLGQEIETLIQLPNGTRRTIQMTIYQFKTGKGFMAGSITHDATERKETEEQLIASETRYRRLFEAARDGVLILGEETGVVTDVNPFLVEMLGLTKEDICGKELWELGYFKDIAANKSHFLELQEKGYIRYDDLPMETSDGRKFHVEFVSNVYLVNHHKVIQCNIRDITQRKQAEEALRESDEKFKYVFDHSLAGKSFTLPTGELNANQAFADMLGYPLDEFNHHKWEDFTHPQDVELTKEANRSMLSGEKESVRFNKRFIHCDGSIVWADVASTLRRDKDGKPLYFMSTFLDITERKHAEEALRDSEAELRALFASMNDVVMVIDKEGVYRKFAPTNPGLLFKPPDELIGRTLNEVFPPGQAKTFMNVLQKVVRTKQPAKIEYDLKIENRTVQFEASIAHLSGDTTLWVVHDITAHKEAEEEILSLNTKLEQRVEERTLELRQAQEKLVRQEKLAMLGQLAGGVGHELRNPLGIISSAIYYLQLVQPKAGGKIKHYHDLIEAEVHNAEKIITELMDFARLESMERGPVSVSDLVGRTLARFTVPEYIKTKLILPGDLPKVFVDSRQMEQVLGNITLNSCQAMGSQNSKTIIGKHMLLTISARRKKGMVAIAVKDTGSGITPENMSKIFEPLFTTKAKGIGLGLAVSRRLAEANGGRIEVKSELGKGSTFTLFLPEGGG